MSEPLSPLRHRPIREYPPLVVREARWLALRDYAAGRTDGMLLGDLVRKHCEQITAYKSPESQPPITEETTMHPSVVDALWREKNDRAANTVTKTAVGVDLLDYFAAMAMQAMIGNEASDFDRAVEAYSQARAMVNVRDDIRDLHEYVVHGGEAGGA